MPRKKKVTSATTNPDVPKKGRRKANDSGKSSPVKKEASDRASQSKDDTQEKVVTFTGLIPVDEECPLDSTTHHVLIANYDVYNAMLHQTNIGDNNNKYYILQVIKHNTKPEYFSWFRWGRVGKVAGKTLKPTSRLSAIEQFSKKFQEKTGNAWRFRNGFLKRNGKYDLVRVDYGQEELKKEEAAKPKKAKVEVKSKLDPRLQEVLNLIFDINEWEQSVKEMKFDIKKAPLGKLTKQQITAGYEALKKIEECIQENDAESYLVQACSKFYTKIPHDFGMSRPPLIKTSEDLKEKLQLLEALSDIQIAMSMLNDNGKDDHLNELDSLYKSLGCGLYPLERKDKEFENIETYLENTNGNTHQQYKLNIEEIFRVDRPSDNEKFKHEIGTRMLLWHGSRLHNWCGILKQGLRIAPPEAPVTGYMFGKGVYFADMASKSANYCNPNMQSIGLLLVCEVALGNMNEKKQYDYNAGNLPKGKHSTKGLGRSVPDPKQFVTLPDGAIIPSGKPTNVTNDDGYLSCNEYVVYDTAQIKPRYLVKAHFQFD